MTTFSTHLHIKRHNRCDPILRLRGFPKMMLYAMLSCDMCDINKITLRGVPFFFWQCVVKFEGFFFLCLYPYSFAFRYCFISSERVSVTCLNARQTLVFCHSFVTHEMPDCASVSHLIKCRRIAEQSI